MVKNPKNPDMAGYALRINAGIKDFFSNKKSFPTDLSLYSESVVTMMHEFSLRPAGRFRGSIAAAAYDSTKSTCYAPQGIQLGIALELLQDYLLIIDDVMDKSVTRRGKPTMHLQLNKESKDDRNQHGSQMKAITTGLIMQHMANSVIISCGELAENITACLAKIHASMVTTGFGQLDDLHQIVGRDVSATDILQKYYMKTSYYTFINPICAGMALAGVTNQEIDKAAYAFGRPAGIAFQLANDLKIFDISKLEADGSNDISEKKYTYVLKYLLANAGHSDIEKLTAILNAKHVSLNDIATFKRICDTTGAVMHIQLKIDSCMARAKSALHEYALFDNWFGELLQSATTKSLNGKTV